MIRAAILIASLALAGVALAQSETPASPAPSAPAEAGASASGDASEELKRLRADFRARFVDYDERLKALSRRIEDLEAKLGAEADKAAGITPTDSSAATMKPEDAPGDAAGAKPGEGSAEGGGDARSTSQ